MLLNICSCFRAKLGRENNDKLLHQIVSIAAYGNNNESQCWDSPCLLHKVERLLSLKTFFFCNKYVNEQSMYVRT